MFYQLKEVIVEFLKEETITRLSIKQIKTLPKIKFGTNYLGDELYEKIDHILNNSLTLDTVEDIQSNSGLKINNLIKFFLKLLNERKFEEFKTYSSYRNYIKSCKIEIRNKEIPCPEPRFKLGLPSMKFGYFYFGNLNESFKQFLHDMNIEQNLEKISFEFSKISSDIGNYIGHYTLSNTQLKFLTIEGEINSFFRSFSVQNLVTTNNLCNSSSNDQIIFSTHDQEFCLNNCLIDISIREYECLIRYDFEHYFDLDEHFKIKNYKLCPSDLFVNDSFISESNEYCQSKCGPECNLIHYEIISKSSKTFNSTKLNIIPISSLHLRYVETFKTDTNRLIYNLGGVMSFWFGISPVSLIYLIELLIGFYRKIKQIWPSCKTYLNLIIRKFVVKVKFFTTIYKNLLIKCFIKTIGSLINLLT